MEADDYKYQPVETEYSKDIQDRDLDRLYWDTLYEDLQSRRQRSNLRDNPIVPRPVTKGGQPDNPLRPWDMGKLPELPDYLYEEDQLSHVPEEPDPITSKAAEHAGVILARRQETDISPRLIGMHMGTVLHATVQAAMERRHVPGLDDFIKPHVPQHWLKLFRAQYPDHYEGIKTAFQAIAEDSARYIEQGRRDGNHVRMVSEVLFSVSHQQRRMIESICSEVALGNLPMDEVRQFLKTGKVSPLYNEYQDTLYSLRPYIQQMVRTKHLTSDGRQQRQRKPVEQWLYTASSRLDGIIFSCDRNDNEAQDVITAAEYMVQGSVFGRNTLLDPHQLEAYNKTIDDLLTCILRGRIKPSIMELKCFFDRAKTKPTDRALTARSTNEEIARSLLPVVEFLMMHYGYRNVSDTMRDPVMKQLLENTTILSFNAYVPFMNSREHKQYTSNPFVHESSLSIEEVPSNVIGRLIANQPRLIARELARQNR